MVMFWLGFLAGILFAVVALALWKVLK